MTSALVTLVMRRKSRLTDAANNLTIRYTEEVLRGVPALFATNLRQRHPDVFVRIEPYEVATDRRSAPPPASRSDRSRKPQAHAAAEATSHSTGTYADVVNRMMKETEQ